MLGIFYSVDEAIKNNWSFRVDKVRTTLTHWRGRTMSLFGRVKVVNTLVLPQLWYSATVLLMSDTVVDEVDKLILIFIWNGKKPLVSQITCFGPF